MRALLNSILIVSYIKYILLAVKSYAGTINAVSDDVGAVFTNKSEIVIRYMFDREVVSDLNIIFYENDGGIFEASGSHFYGVNRKQSAQVEYDMYLHQQHLQIFDKLHNTSVIKGLKIAYYFTELRNSVDDDANEIFYPRPSFAKIPEVHRFDDYTSLENPSKGVEFYERWEMPSSVGEVSYGDIVFSDVTDAVYIPFNYWYTSIAVDQPADLYTGKIYLTISVEF